jgi:mannose-6-phosphate isomerase-like protein (cupin superfamily)
LSGSARATIGGAEHDLRPGTAVFVARGTSWSADGDAVAVSVLVHQPQAASRAHAVLDLAVAGRDSATAGRQFILGATPASGCASVTQFIGLIPPGRAPDHFHSYDEVLYVLEGEGVVEIGGEQAPLRPGSCVHLPARLVHCLANTGDSEMRVLGVFRPAGSPAEAYYPDGTLAVVPTEE